MQDSSTALTTIQQFRQDIQARLRERVREAIEATLDEELAAALGSARHERTVVRRGYRHGAITRTVTTAAGTRTLEVPRGRVRTTTGTNEFRSEMLPRYARRTREVDDARLACYLAGANSRRIRTALKPLPGETHLSKSAVSRGVARLKALFTTWQGRDLHGERYALLFLDGFHLRVRLAGRVVVVPVLAALGVTETGQKQLVGLQLAAAEATASWSGLLTVTFYAFPKAMWKSLRTTNALENLNREFRHRTKTQASFGTEAAALTLLYGLVAFGQIVLRRIDGHEQLPEFLAKEWSQAA